MKTILKTTKIRVDEALENFIKEKIDDLDRFYENGRLKAVAHLEIEKTTQHHQKGPFFRAECQIRLSKKTVRAEAVDKNLKLAVIEVKNELQRQLKQYKEKFSAKTERGQRALKKEFHLSPQARFFRKGRIREEGI